MKNRAQLGWTRLSMAVALLVLLVTVPAAAQYSIYDLGAPVGTHDIQADNNNTVHLVWTSGGFIYYGRIVNNAITGKVQIGSGLNTVYWRPYFSVTPDGSSVHVAWTTMGGHGNKLMHSWKDSVGWHTETVLTVPLTQWLSQPTCAADANGLVHVMYVIWNDTSNQWSTIFYQRKLANGSWEAKAMFTPQSPEYKHPMMFTDSTGRVHATWDVAGGTFDAYYCTAPSGGKLSYANMIKIPKRSDNNVSGYGDIYVDRNGAVHRSVGGWSNAQRMMCIDHSVKPVGGAFATPTRASIGFLNLSGTMDPVPAVVAAEDGRVVVAWGQVSAAGANEVKASFYDPGLRSWSIYTIDPAAGVPDRPNAYRVALTRTSTHLYGVWRGADGHLQLFTLPLSGSSLTVTSPNGGEELQADDTHSITWNAVDLAGTAAIALYKAGTKVADIGTASVNAETFSWNIPRSTPAGTGYRVRVTQGANVDESNADFTILEANAPRIEVSPATLKFGGSTLGDHTQAQKVLLIDGKGGQLHWTASKSGSWLSVSPTSGTGDGYVTISVNPTGLSAGTYTGSVSITDPDAVNSPQAISVTLEVQVTTAAAIGAFESPKDRANVKGNISLSGWALDDLGVASLEIRRDAVKSDLPENIGKDGRVYVGTAAFIEGSRPEIETLYPSYPLKNRAGWGYMLMTYGLPGGGNGTFVLHAIATDQEGNSVEIGKRTIIASNKYNTKPFGAIDAPAWGETIGGTAYADTGWMLTPRPKIIATTGKTIWVWIDGVKQAHPVYKQYRADIALMFPTLRNKDGAGGTYTFNTTSYANGLHTIKWVASDSAGAMGNTGTSYFRVLNTPSGTVPASVSASKMKTDDTGMATVGLLTGIPQDYRTPLFRRTGFGAERIFEPAYPDDRGVIEAVMEEDSVVEVRLGTSGPVQGYLVVGDELRPLPVGSTLDAGDGTFRWMPGPGFLGRYDLAFVGSTTDGITVKRLVTVRIIPAQPAD